MASRVALLCRQQSRCHERASPQLANRHELARRQRIALHRRCEWVQPPLNVRYFAARYFTSRHCRVRKCRLAGPQTSFYAPPPPSHTTVNRCRSPSVDECNWGSVSPSLCSSRLAWCPTKASSRRGPVLAWSGTLTKSSNGSTDFNRLDAGHRGRVSRLRLVGDDHFSRPTDRGWRRHHSALADIGTLTGDNPQTTAPLPRADRARASGNATRRRNRSLALRRWPIGAAPVCVAGEKPAPDGRRSNF